jgi:5-methyltetrahydropteroyltriglutamate--homocysteine methyltransferase
MNTILPTTLVGSYPQPDWLIDRAKLAGRFPPRDDKIRVNSSSLDHPLVILPDQGIEIVAIEKKVMVGRVARSAYSLNRGLLL